MGCVSMLLRKEITVLSSPLGWKNRLINIAFYYRVLFPLRLFFQFFLHIYLPASAYHKKVRMGHCYNITLNPKVILGRNVTIYHGVTIGSKQFGRGAGVPVIGDDVIIYPNSVILGDITVGSGSIIGAGAVVIKDVPVNAVVAGNPAKNISFVIDPISSE